MTNEVDLIQEKIQRHLSNNDLTSALHELRTWIDALLSDVRIMGSVFGSREIDQLCIQIGELASNQRTPLAEQDASQPSVDYVIIASELYITGGHTALIEDYLKALPQKTSRILITDPDNTVDRNSIRQQNVYQ